MAVRFSMRLAAAACLGLSATAGAGEPATKTPTASVAIHPDQKLADTVAQKLANSGQLSGYRVEVSCDQGDVELTGTVSAASQRAEVMKIVRSVRGVRNISDQMSVDRAIVPAQAIEPIPAPGGPQMMPPGSVPHGMPQGMPNSFPSGGMQNAMPVGPSYGGPYGGAGGGYATGMDPSPIGVPPTGGLYDSGQPKMPPYAWPTYAPHNNYSRVGYPTEYPRNAFPFIGPFYPFPKVPLGFRAIKLEWEDGHWYYGRTATNRDFWKVRYW